MIVESNLGNFTVTCSCGSTKIELSNKYVNDFLGKHILVILRCSECKKETELYEGDVGDFINER